MDFPTNARKRQRTGSAESIPERKREKGELNDEETHRQPCARWSQVIDDGSYEIDTERIKCFLAEGDEERIRDIISGIQLSGQVWPLIFDSANEVQGDSACLRSIPYFEGLLIDRDAGKEQYASLSSHCKRIVGVGLRDLYLATWHGYTNNREKSILENMVNVVDASVGCVQVRGMNVSFYPTAGFKALKFIEDLDKDIDSEMAGFLAQVMETPRLFAVFVDPADLSFHNFENIVPMDRWIDSRTNQSLELSLTDIQQVKTDREVFSSTLQGTACNLISDLSTLDLYTTPFNKATRGGERFIFHSALLSKALTGALHKSGILNIISGGTLESSFEFVNYIFRCNRFSPGDGKFNSHLDTPYYDASNSHVSKYTVVIYISPGHGEPALRINDVEVTDVQAMTCIIFDQRFEHEGQPFLDNDKVFIRSELIFKDEPLSHDNQIGSLFSSACYFAAESVFKEELGTYAHECFERANSLHWGLEQKASTPAVYLHKTFQALEFITNGCDYWFKRDMHTNAADCALVAFLDSSNCRVEGRPFRSLCKTTIIQEQVTSTDEIWPLLDSGLLEDPVIKRLVKSDIDPYIQTRPKTPFFPREPREGFDESDSEEEDWENPCCAFHCYRTFDAWKDRDVWREYRKCWRYTRKQLFNTPLVILGQGLYMNEKNIVVKGDKVYFLRSPDTPPLPPLNFAACWADLSPANMIISEQQQGISAPDLLLPPVLFHEYEQGYHLVVDLFRNDWMVKVDDTRKIAVPVISNDISDGIEETTFWSEVGVEEDDVDEVIGDFGSLDGWSVGGTISGDEDEDEEVLGECEDELGSDTSATLAHANG
ncbi:hypothetical protein BDV12DRAFT_11833 [Aspergillus spectabilis]